MAGRFGADAKITRSADEAGAEMTKPDAIDHHARGERVVRRHDGLRKFEPATAVLEWLTARTCDNFEKLTWRFVAKAGGIAANKNARIALDFAIFQDQRVW